MKNLIIITTFLFAGFLKSQKLSVQYNALVKNDFTNTYYTFPAILESDSKKRIKLYFVEFGIKEESKAIADNVGVITSKKKFRYQLYSTNLIKPLISDDIQGKMYLLQDDFVEFKWKILNETKTVNNILLNKASTNFRGRNYIIWYDKKVSTYYGPWKFNNVPGLVYEISDETKSFKWELVSYKVSKNEINNPFLNSTEKFWNYKDYPKIRYGLSPELVEALKQNPNNQIFEQERNGLEIKFEWEK